MQNRMVYIKAVISAGLIVYLVGKINISNMIDAMAGVHTNLLILSCAIFFVQQVIMVLAWGVLIWSQEKEIPYHSILYAHLIGNFFGTLLPSSVGIDIIRAYSLSKKLKNGVHAVSSLFLCRTIAFIILFLLAMIFAIRVAALTSSGNIFLALFLILLCFTTFLTITYHPGLYGTLASLLQRLHIGSFAAKMEQFRKSLVSLSRQHSVLWKIIVLTVIFQMLGIFVVYLLGLALSIPVGLVFYFVFIPVIMVVTLIPISLAGIGVREASFVYLFSQVGATGAQGLSLSLMMFFQTILLALIGGLVYGIHILLVRTRAENDPCP